MASHIRPLKQRGDHTQPGSLTYTPYDDAVLGTAIGNDDSYVLQRSLELDRELVER